MRLLGVALCALLLLSGCGSRPTSSASPGTSATASASTSPTPANQSSPADPGSEPLTPNAWRAQQGQAAIKTLADHPDLAGAGEVRNSFAPGSSAAAIDRGRALFNKNCLQCHGRGGVPDPNSQMTARYNPADLREPTLYKFGADDKAIYRSIAHGVPTAPMGFYKGVLSEDQIWDLTYYVMSLHKS